MEPTSRRWLLRTTGTVAAGALAGCPGRDRPCGGGPASFEPTVDVDPVVAVGPFGADDAWPNRHRDPACTAATAAPGPRSSVVRAWRYDAADASGETWGVRAGDRTYLAADSGPALAAVDPNGRRVVWRYPELGSGAPPAVAPAAGVVVVGGDAGLHGVEIEGGRRRWHRPTRSYGATLVAADVAYAMTEDGLVAVEAATGEELWRRLEPELYLGAVAADRVLVGDPLRALDSADGAELWRNDEVATFGDVAVRDGTAYVAAGRGVHAVDVADGQRRWRFRGIAASYARPAVGPSTAFVGVGYEAGGGGHLLALDRESGEVRWCVNLGERSVQPAAVGADVVYVAANELLQARAVDDGSIHWTAETDREFGRPFLADGALFAPDFGGRLDVFVEG